MPVMTGLLCLLYIVHRCLENVAVQSSSYNWPTEINECLRISGSDACWDTFGSRRLYPACAVMLSPLGIITFEALEAYGT